MGAAEICQEFRPGKAAAEAAVLPLLWSLMRGPHWAPQAPRAHLLDHNEVKFSRSVSKIVLLHKFLFHFKNFTGTWRITTWVPFYKFECQFFYLNQDIHAI